MFKTNDRPTLGTANQQRRRLNGRSKVMAAAICQESEESLGFSAPYHSRPETGAGRFIEKPRNIRVIIR